MLKWQDTTGKGANKQTSTKCSRIQRDCEIAFQAVWSRVFCSARAAPAGGLAVTSRPIRIKLPHPLLQGGVTGIQTVERAGRRQRTLIQAGAALHPRDSAPHLATRAPLPVLLAGLARGRLEVSAGAASHGGAGAAPAGDLAVACGREGERRRTHKVGNVLIQCLHCMASPPCRPTRPTFEQLAGRLHVPGAALAPGCLVLAGVAAGRHIGACARRAEAGCGAGLRGGGWGGRCGGSRCSSGASTTAAAGGSALTALAGLLAEARHPCLATLAPGSLQQESQWFSQCDALPRVSALHAT